MIGLITINDYKNIGNRLQNYAMFNVLSHYGKTYNIIRFLGCEDKIKARIEMELCSDLIKNTIKFFLPGYHYSAKRYFAFKQFNRKIKNGEILGKDTNYSKLNKRYCCFFTGSDQVWNPTFKGNGMYINMLGFADENKCFAGCPSISIDDLTEKQKDEFTKYLSRFTALSCREAKGSEIIESLTGKKCITLVDPTLLLQRSEWERIERKPIFHICCKFLLVYMLGEINDSYSEYIQSISKLEGLQIINITDKSSVYYSCGPSEFIYLVKRCDCIVTDSFHGLVFSLLFNKRIKVLRRVDATTEMTSRFDSIFTALEMNKDVFLSNNKDKPVELSFSVDKLENERRKSKLYYESIFQKKN